nr:hypothetical protein [Micromonospora sp. DSM 115978]
AEEHHGGCPPDTPTTRGTVTSIDAVHCQYERVAGSAQNEVRPVPGTTTLTPIEAADGWESDDPDARFVGYVVALDEW